MYVLPLRANKMRRALGAYVVDPGTIAEPPAKVSL
jgi:hypothetical protein